MSDLNIYQRINEVKKEVTYVKKDAKVQGYKAVTHDQVTAVLRESMVKHGIVTTQSILKSSFVETGGLTASGTKWRMYTATYEIVLINVDEPHDRVMINVESQASDTGDKATGKAMSYAKKNCYLKVFDLETGENDEGRQDDFKQKREDKQLITEDEVGQLKKLIEDTDSDEGKFLNYLNVGTLEEMQKGTFKGALAMLNKKLAESKK